MMGRQERIKRSQEQWAAVDWQDVATFIGSNPGRFEKVWRKLGDAIAAKGYGNVTSFCWPAFFFSFAWFFARKQWAAGAVLLILPIAIGLIFQDIPRSATTGVSVAIVMLAKSIYLQASIPKIAHIVANTMPGPDRDDQLRQAGGLSLAGGIGGGIVWLIAIASLIYGIISPA